MVTQGSKVAPCGHLKGMWGTWPVVVPCAPASGALMRAAPGPPLGLGCSSLPTEATHMMQCLYPLLMVPGTKCLWWTMGCMITAPVNVSLQLNQHSTPGMSTQKFGPWAHKYGTVIHGPHEALEMSGILNIKEG